MNDAEKALCKAINVLRQYPHGSTPFEASLILFQLLPLVADGEGPEQRFMRAIGTAILEYNNTEAPITKRGAPVPGSRYAAALLCDCPVHVEGEPFRKGPNCPFAAHMLWGQDGEPLRLDQYPCDV